jgi:steroid delta-isomerase-like uncharacterized protein
MSKSIEENKALVRRWNESLNTGNAGIWDELGATGYVFHGADRDYGVQEMKRWMTAYRQAFSDIRLTVEDMIAEGDRVAIRYSIRATHKGPYLGIAATGRIVTVTGMSAYRIKDGRIAEDWGVADSLSQLQQLGAVPAFG